MPGVWIYQDSEEAAGYPTGHWTNAALLLFVAVVSLGLTLYYVRKNRKLREYADSQGPGYSRISYDEMHVTSKPC